MLIAIPPKYAVAQVVGFIKGKSAIHLARVYRERKRNFVGQHFWARGYFVSTVGHDEAVIRSYIQTAGTEDRAWTNWDSGGEGPPRRWRLTLRGRVSAPVSRFERLAT